MISYSWTIQRLRYELGPDSEGHSDIVSSIDWLLTASDGEDPPHEAAWGGIAHMTWTEGDDWIPYEDLTEADIVSWIENDIEEDKLASMKSQLNEQVEEKANPTEVFADTGALPWDPVIDMQQEEEETP